MPLRGTRVLDLTRTPVGERTAALLAGLGAGVVRVGAACAAVPTAAALDVELGHPWAAALVRRLAAASDVVLDDGSVTEAVGVVDDELRDLNPGVVHLVLLGTSASADDVHDRAGLTAVVGQPAGPPLGWPVPYADHVGALTAAFAVVGAIVHRQRTGEGQDLDVSRLEPTTALHGALLLDNLVNGRRTRGRRDFPSGGDTGGGPQGVYRCAGEDRWIAISCTTEPQWAALRDVMGAPAWSHDAQFATLAQRRANRAELDARVDAWAAQRDRYELMYHLQARGVPAGVVQDAADLDRRDEQLADRGAGPPFRLSHVPAPARGVPSADDVLRDVARLSEHDIAQVRTEGLLR